MTQLDIDPATFAHGFGRAPFPVHHHLADHPLLTVDAIADLADRLPAASVEHNHGDLPDVATAADVVRLDASPGDIARGIDGNGCWMVLKNIEQETAYRRLLEDTLAEVEPLVPGSEGGMVRQEGFVFLSAPGSVTPSHVDPEHNLLLQVRGTKTMRIGRFEDARVEQREIERFHAAADRHMSSRVEDAVDFSLAAGDGVYVPVFAPHLVHNGAQVSVSLSITFYTPRILDLARLHGINARLRRLRLSPSVPGARPRADRAKLALAAGSRGLLRAR